MALQLFALTLFVSAFVLFLVQPMIGKLILPQLGGTPQVWNTCMVFFQTALLAGYAYTHTASTKLKLRQQLITHGVLLLIPFLFLLPYPFNTTNFEPPTDGNPIWYTLLTLAALVGVPFIVVATTAPLLQKWFTFTGERDPYFLYGASNLGSLLSLIAYPILIEPFLNLSTQRYFWLLLYAILGALVFCCVALVWKSARPEVLDADADKDIEPAASSEADPAPMPVPAASTSTAIKSGTPGTRLAGKKKGVKLAPVSEAPAGRAAAIEPAVTTATDEVTIWRRIRWVLLAAVPSSLMLGITSYISTDLSPFPLLWVIPLALYLLTFILVFIPEWTGTNLRASRRFGTQASSFTPHSLFLYVLQPAGALALAWVLLTRGFDPYKTTALLMFGFTCVTFMCHGELARERPSTRYLTEFFLLMSVGGMLGGMFNAIFAPLLFTGVYEFPIAVAIACLVRPQLQQGGWLDNLILNLAPDFSKWVRETGDELAGSFGFRKPHTTYLFNIFMDVLLAGFVLLFTYWMKSSANESWNWWSGDPSKNGLMRTLKTLGFSNRAIQIYFSMFVNVALYAIPMVMCFLFNPRPLRIGLGVAALLFAGLYMASEREGNLLAAKRTYFGVLRVYKESEVPLDPEERAEFKVGMLGAGESERINYTYLMHGTTYHGRNYLASEGKTDLSRLATTYYHRYGPVGVVMERYNWLPGPQNNFQSDVRMPAGLLGLGAAGLGTVPLPLDMITHGWSEPPFATIGLGTGTMASYGRPYQHVAYYEIDEQIRNFSLPTEGKPLFTYLRNAAQRGSNVEVIMGDARLSMRKEEPKNAIFPTVDKDKISLNASTIPQPREGYYRVMVVDAFSSDAIPVHLLTKEAVELYMSKLTDDGILCVHTSNRHMDLVKPVAKIVEELGLRCRVGKDEAGRGGEDSKYLGHFSSEYVMVYRNNKHGDDFEKYLKDFKENNPFQKSRVTWYNPANLTPPQVAAQLWTDDYSNIWSIIRPWH